MHPFDELKDYVGFGADDEQHLCALRPHVMPNVHAITDRFYATILRFPSAAAVFEDLAQVERLKRSLERWIEQLLSGPWDEAYYQTRLRIGRVHVRVQLPSQFMFTSMNRLMEDLHDIARAAFGDAVSPYATALRRIADIELAIMLGTYIETREKQGLEDFRDVIISHLPMTVLLVDRAGVVVASTSPQGGLFVAPAVNGQELSCVLHPAVREDVDLAAMVERAMEREQEVVVPRIETNLHGARRTFRLSVVPLRHPLANALVHVEDLTDAIASETRAKQAEHLAKLGTLAATVAHEIRNPLAGISGTVQVIANTLPEGDERRIALAKVQEQIGRLGILVGDLLSFSRPITAQLRDVELASLATQVLAQTRGSDESATQVRGAARAHVDPALLVQVLVNLALNAWQAGAKRVEIDVSEGCLLVADDGPGIPKGEQESVFQPFFTTKTRGTGLGLPLARKLVEAMHGTLELTTSPLGGAAFELRLRPPLDAAEEA